MHAGIERRRPGGGVLRAPSRTYGVDLDRLIGPAGLVRTRRRSSPGRRPSVVTVGYQRPCAMFWTSVKVLVAGSKTDDFGGP